MKGTTFINITIYQIVVTITLYKSISSIVEFIALILLFTMILPIVFVVILELKKQFETAQNNRKN